MATWDEHGNPVTEWDENGKPVSQAAAATPKTSQLASAGMGAVDAGTFGWIDELAALAKPAHDYLDKTFGRPPWRSGAVPGGEETRAELGQAQKDNPVSFGAGQVAGSLAIPYGEMKTLPQVALKLGLSGAAYGAGSGETPEQRLKQAGTGALGAAALGGAFHAVTAPFLRAATPATTQAALKIAQFDKAGVRPTAAAVAPSHSLAPSATKAIAENWLAGGRARGAIQGSLDDTAQASKTLAGKYGTAATPEVTGGNVRAGLQAWNQTFKQRAENIYTKALGPLVAAPAAPIETERTIGDILNRVTPGTASAQIIIPRQMTKIAEALQNDQGKLSFGDLRAWRTWVREAQKEPSIAQGIDAGSLERLEGALTTDIYRSADQIGGPKALRQLQQADLFYRTGIERVKRSLAPFMDPRGTDAGAYQRIIGLASDGGRQNTRSLIALKQSLPQSQWRDVAASLIDNMGNVKPGAPNAAQPGAFSVENFVTNYAKMSPQGRAVLFGKTGGGNGAATTLSGELDNLAQVAGMQKGVERMANHSHSGLSFQNISTLGGLFSGVATIPTALALAGEAVTGEALTNPAFVRWFAAAGRQRAVTPQAIRQLGFLAARDPALQPVYQAVAGQAGALANGQSPAPESMSLRAGSRSP